MITTVFRLTSATAIALTMLSAPGFAGQKSPFGNATNDEAGTGSFVDDVGTINDRNPDGDTEFAESNVEDLGSFEAGREEDFDEGGIDENSALDGWGTGDDATFYDEGGETDLVRPDEEDWDGSIDQPFMGDRDDTGDRSYWDG